MSNPVLLRLPAEEIEHLHEIGQISDEDALEYLGVKHLEQGGHYLDLDTDTAEVLYNRGHLSESQAGTYLDYWESKWGSFYAKDTLYGVGHGVMEAQQEVNQRIGQLLELVLPTEMTPEQQLEVVDVDSPMPAVPLFTLTKPVKYEEPTTFPGQFASNVSQFAAGFIPGLGTASKIMKMGKLAQFSKMHKGIAGFLATQIASLQATATVIDPWEDRLSNLISDHTPLDEVQREAIDFDTPMPAVPSALWLDPIVNFLKADPNDSAAAAIAKSVIEDQLLGAFMEPGMEMAKHVWNGLTVMKRQVWQMKGDEPAAVAREVNEVASRIAERENITSSEYHPANRQWDSSEHTSGITRTVKRRVNDPDRWLYIAEEETQRAEPVRPEVAEPETPPAPKMEDLTAAATPPKPPYTHTGFIVSDQGQLVPVIRGYSEEEVARRMAMIKQNGATVSLYTKQLEKEGFTFENFKKAVTGDQEVVDLFKDTSVYRVESSRLLPGEMTPTLEAKKLQPLPEVRILQHDAPGPTPPVDAHVQARNLSLGEAPVPKTAGEAADMVMEEIRYQKQLAEQIRQAEELELPTDELQKRMKATIEIDPEEMPEVVATILQLAKGMENFDQMADYKLLMDEGYPIKGLTACESRAMTGVNLLRVVHPENTLQIMTHVYQHFVDRIKAAGGGARIAMEETNAQAFERIAQYTGIADAYASMRQLNAICNELPVAIRAAELVFHGVADILGEVAVRAASQEDRLLVMEMARSFTEMFALVHGSKANIGRALNIQRMTKGGARYGFHLLDPAAIADIYSHVGNDAEQVTKAIADLKKSGNTKAIAGFVRKYHGIRWVGALVELKLSSMLSAPTTFMKNLLGTTSRMLWEEVNMDIALGLQGIKNQDIELFKEIGRRWWSQGYAMLDCFGAVKGWKGAAEALKTGKGLDQAVLDGLKGFFGSDFWSVLRSGDNVLDPVKKFEFQGGMIPSWKWLPLGDFIRFPFYALSATDEMLQHAAYAGAQRSNAISMGLKEGLTGNDLKRFVLEKIDKPDIKFHIKNIEDSRRMIFKSNLEGGQKDFHNWVNNLNDRNIFTKLFGPLAKSVFLPFDKVLFNILNAVGEATPFGLVSRKFKADWAAGGPQRTAGVLRMATGTAMMFMGYMMYFNGSLRGATPYRDKGTAQALHLLDNAYFDKSTGEWKSLTGLDPAAMFFTMGANVAQLADVVGHMDPEIEDRFEQLVMQGIGVLSEAVSWAPGMEGAHDLLRIIFDPGGTNTLGRMISTQLGSFMPYGNLLKWANNVYGDPEYRDLGNMFRSWESAKNALWNQYFNREGMLPRRHILFGERSEEMEGYTIWGGQKREMLLDDSLLEISDLHMAVDRMDDKFTLDGVSKRLSPEQMDKANEYLTQLSIFPGVTGLRETLNYLVNTPEYQMIQVKELRAKTIRDVIGEFRRAAKEMLFVSDPSLQSAIESKLRQRVDIQLGVAVQHDDHKALTNHLREYLKGRTRDGQ